MSLLLQIDRYCRRTGTPRTKFGRLSVNDPRLIDDMMRGRQIGPDVQARVEAFIARGQA